MRRLQLGENVCHLFRQVENTLITNNNTILNDSCEPDQKVIVATQMDEFIAILDPHIIICAHTIALVCIAPDSSTDDFGSGCGNRCGLSHVGQFLDKLLVKTCSNLVWFIEIRFFIFFLAVDTFRIVPGSIEDQRLAPIRVQKFTLESTDWYLWRLAQ